MIQAKNLFNSTNAKMSKNLQEPQHWFFQNYFVSNQKVIKSIFVLFFFLYLIMFLCPQKSIAEVPNMVLLDFNNSNGAIVGKVVNSIQYDDYLEAEVEVSNPKFFWTKIIFVDISGVNPDPISAYAHLGFLGPVSSTIPFEPGFSFARFKLRFENEFAVSIGVDPTVESGPEAPIFNLAQVILTAAPAVPGVVTISKLEAMLEEMNNFKEILLLSPQHCQLYQLGKVKSSFIDQTWFVAPAAIAGVL